MKKLTVVAIMVFAVAALLMVTATPSEAVHGASTELTCGQCHTMHSSQGGDNAPDMGGATGSNILLRVGATSEVSDLCLSCHAEDGTAGDQEYNTSGSGWETYPPKVLRTTGAWTSVSTNFATIGAGGDFSTVLALGAGVYSPQGVDAGVDGTASLGYGHSINNSNPITPPGATGGASFTDFSCTNCHDPHGVSATTTEINLYRNLKSGLGDNGIVWAADIADSYIGGVAGLATGAVNTGTAQTIWPVFKDAGNQNTYFTGAADDNMSKFCAQCHGLWHEDITAGNGAGGGSTDWARHPVDLALDDGGAANQLSANGTTIVDWTNYNAIAAGTKLPAMQTNSVASVYYADAAVDKVFCLSCHFAHAGPNYDALRWAYQSSVGAGTQIGISLGSTVGCQQCHNRG